MVFSALRKFALGLGIAVLTATPVSAETGEIIYDIVIENGRAMDPETGLDAVRNIGISSGTISAISEMPIRGKTVIDARDHVVAHRVLLTSTRIARPRSVFFIRPMMA